MATTTHTSTDPVIALLVTADHHGLPTGHSTARDGQAHVFLADVYEMRPWLNALGGTVTRQPAGSGVEMWVLHTHTEARSDGSQTCIVLRSLALAEQRIHPDLTEAATQTPAA